MVAAATAETVQRYPETTYLRLRELISETYNVPVDDVTVSAGSLGVLTGLVQTFAGTNDDGTPDEVIIPWRSFEAYPIVVRSAGAKDVQVPLLDNGEHDLDRKSTRLNSSHVASSYAVLSLKKKQKE